MCFELLADVLPEDHRARLLWRVVETLDLSAFARGRKSVKGHAGRDVTSVRMLLTLWLYAISSGIGSAREIERSRVVKRVSTPAKSCWRSAKDMGFSQSAAVGTPASRC